MSVESPIWLNAEFLQKVLRNSENDRTIEVKSLTTRPAVGKGDNYGSKLVRAMVEYSRDKSGREEIEKKSVIIKMALVPTGVYDELTLTSFENEIRMMDSTLSKMNKMLNNIERGYRLSPRSLYTNIGDPYLLVIEDLTPLGYRMADRRVGLDLEHAIVAIKGIAKFHASSVALYEEDPTVINKCGKGMYHEDYPANWKIFFVNGLKVLANEILNWSELGSRAKGYSEKILKLSEVGYEKAAKCLRPKTERFNVMNHGDFWVNNILFRYNDEGRVTDQIFVDFQLSLWNSPALDIGNFFNSSLSNDVDLHHRDTLVEEYLKTLTKIMSELGCKTEPPSQADFAKSLLELEFHGAMTSLLLLPLVLIDANDVMSFEEMMQEQGGYKNPAYALPVYRKILSRRLPTFDAHGSLDV